jgi:hypothetical protein
LIVARTFEIWRIETTYLSSTPLRVSVLRNIEMLSQGHQNLDVFQRAGDMGQAQQTGQNGMNYGHNLVLNYIALKLVHVILLSKTRHAFDCSCRILSWFSKSSNSWHPIEELKVKVELTPLAAERVSPNWIDAILNSSCAK